MKRITALISLLLVTYPVGTVLAVETSNLRDASTVESNITLEQEVELSKAFEHLGDSGSVSIEEISNHAIEVIKYNSDLSSTEKTAQISQIQDILKESKATNKSLGFQYVKPGPGRIRIFIPPMAVKIVLAVGVSAYVLSMLTSLGITGAVSYIVVGVVYEAISNQSAVRRGFTLHGWNNYRSWQFRVGNTLAG